MVARPIVLIVEPVVPNCDRVLSDAPTSEAVRCQFQESLTASEISGVERIGECELCVTSEAVVEFHPFAYTLSVLPVVALDGDFYIRKLGDEVGEGEADSNRKCAFFFFFFESSGIYFKIDLSGGLNRSRYFTYTCSKYRTLYTDPVLYHALHPTHQSYMYAKV
jgi:hypothetical protein